MRAHRTATGRLTAAAGALIAAAATAPAAWAADDPVHFMPCPTATAAPGTTNLRSGTVTASGAGGRRYDLDVDAGRLRAVHVMALRLPDGRLASGSGFDAALADREGKPGFVHVADGSVTADVTRAEFTYDGGGERIAFVELRVGAGRPVRWAEAPGLLIGTDGGDGGFWSADARTMGIADEGTDGYIDAMTGTGCVLRRNESQEVPNGFLFDVGIGDGGYPTLLGYDAQGHVVSVVNYGFVVPWALSGLPGTPPEEVVAETQRRRRAPAPGEAQAASAVTGTAARGTGAESAADRAADRAAERAELTAGPSNAGAGTSAWVLRAYVAAGGALAVLGVTYLRDRRRRD